MFSTYVEADWVTRLLKEVPSGVGERTVESHVAAIFRTLGLPANHGANRRVQAAIAYVDAQRR